MGRPNGGARRIEEIIRGALLRPREERSNQRVDAEAEAADHEKYEDHQEHGSHRFLPLVGSLLAALAESPGACQQVPAAVRAEHERPPGRVAFGHAVVVVVSVVGQVNTS